MSNIRNERYYISTGADRVMYTLRHSYDETIYGQGGRVYDVHRDYHVANLAQDQDKALARAREIMGVGPDHEIKILDAPVNDRAKAQRSVPEDPVLLKFGKYSGKTIHEVFQEDPQYLSWAAYNVTGKRHRKTMELARQLVKPMVDAQKKSRAEHKERIENERKLSTWQGKPREKIERTVSCVHSQLCNTTYGYSVLFIFKDKGLNIYNWFCSGITPDLEKGDLVKISATVKEHKEWKGQKSTVLIRVKVKEKLNDSV